MFLSLEAWLQEILHFRCKEKQYGEIFSNGYLMGQILYEYGLCPNFQFSFVNKSYQPIVKQNFLHLKEIFYKINVNFDLEAQESFDKKDSKAVQKFLKTLQTKLEPLEKNRQNANKHGLAESVFIIRNKSSLLPCKITRIEEKLHKFEEHRLNAEKIIQEQMRNAKSEKNLLVKSLVMQSRDRIKNQHKKIKLSHEISMKIWKNNQQRLNKFENFFTAHNELQTEKMKLVNSMIINKESAEVFQEIKEYEENTANSIKKDDDDQFRFNLKQSQLYLTEKIQSYFVNMKEKKKQQNRFAVYIKNSMAEYIKQGNEENLLKYYNSLIEIKINQSHREKFEEEREAIREENRLIFIETIEKQKKLQYEASVQKLFGLKSGQDIEKEKSKTKKIKLLLSEELLNIKVKKWNQHYNNCSKLIEDILLITEVCYEEIKKKSNPQIDSKLWAKFSQKFKNGDPIIEKIDSPFFDLLEFSTNARKLPIADSQQDSDLLTGKHSYVGALLNLPTNEALYLKYAECIDIVYPPQTYEPNYEIQHLLKYIPLKFIFLSTSSIQDSYLKFFQSKYNVTMISVKEIENSWNQINNQIPEPSSSYKQQIYTLLSEYNMNNVDSSRKMYLASQLTLLSALEKLKTIFNPNDIIQNYNIAKKKYEEELQKNEKSVQKKSTQKGKLLPAPQNPINSIFFSIGFCFHSFSSLEMAENFIKFFSNYCDKDDLINKEGKILKEKCSKILNYVPKNTVAKENHVCGFDKIFMEENLIFENDRSKDKPNEFYNFSLFLKKFDEKSNKDLLMTLKEPINQQLIQHITLEFDNITQQCYQIYQKNENFDLLPPTPNEIPTLQKTCLFDIDKFISFADGDYVNKLLVCEAALKEQKEKIKADLLKFQKKILSCLAEIKDKIELIRNFINNYNKYIKDFPGYVPMEESQKALKKQANKLHDEMFALTLSKQKKAHKYFEEFKSSKYFDKNAEIFYKSAFLLVDNEIKMFHKSITLINYIFSKSNENNSHENSKLIQNNEGGLWFNLNELPCNLEQLENIWKNMLAGLNQICNNAIQQLPEVAKNIILMENQICIEKLLRIHTMVYHEILTMQEFENNAMKQVHEWFKTWIKEENALVKKILQNIEVKINSGSVLSLESSYSINCDLLQKSPVVIWKKWPYLIASFNYQDNHLRFKYSNFLQFIQLLFEQKQSITVETLILFQKKNLLPEIFDNFDNANYEIFIKNLNKMAKSNFQNVVVLFAALDLPLIPRNIKTEFLDSLSFYPTGVFLPNTFLECILPWEKTDSQFNFEFNYVYFIKRVMLMMYSELSLENLQEILDFFEITHENEIPLKLFDKLLQMDEQMMGRFKFSTKRVE